MKRHLALAALCFGLTTQALLAYGPIGHETVGAIADARLAGTPTAAKIRALLQGLSLEKAAVIPDEIKGWDKKGVDAPGIFRYSSRPLVDAQLADFWRANPPTQDHKSPVPSHHWFHYTDVPLLTPEKYGDGKAGRDQWDIVHMMRYCIRVLRGEEPEDNPRKITKAVAIILLAHFVGDIHQPLHVGAEYFNAQGQMVDPDKTSGPLEDQGGNTITLRQSVAAAGKTGQAFTKLHGFWDNQAVMANLPDFSRLPKDERRAKMEEARKALVQQMAHNEPKNWQLSAEVKVEDYPEKWANEILPIAREAHERLLFSDVHPKQDEPTVAVTGAAEEKPMPDGASYYDWSAKVVREELHLAGWRLADLLQKALQ
ncbi:MAG: S1/P1 nuclease [Chthoniobacterales bacterium]